MADFQEILTATEETLVRLFYRVKPLAKDDFIAKINHAAAQLGVNHAQLVCALGFNKNIRELTDILSLVGFSSYKLLSYRRNEYFSTDTYQSLNVDNILDVYTARIEDDELLNTLRELLPVRLAAIEAKISQGDDPTTVMSYKMEIHAIYAGGVATREFAERRMSREIGRFRLMTDEVRMVVDGQIIPAGNLFFLDSLLPEEKKLLIDAGGVSDLMIRNRMQNTSITADERDMLEGYI